MVDKNYRVVLSYIAVDKLKKINAYYKENHSIQLGKKLTEALLAEVKNLQHLPESKTILKTKKKIVPPFRYTKKWSFKIVFQVYPNDDTVIILDFIHDQENPDKWEDL
jgi:plasmid stabilization system protein ParE